MVGQLLSLLTGRKKTQMLQFLLSASGWTIKVGTSQIRWAWKPYLLQCWQVGTLASPIPHRHHSWSERPKAEPRIQDVASPVHNTRGQSLVLLA